MKKALAPASKQDTRATRVGSWTLYHGPFSLSIRAAGWGKIAPGSSSGKAPSGCCDPRKAGEFGAENNRVRHRFAGVRHGLAEAGEAAFPPWDRWNTTEGKGPFHAHATAQNRAQKKEWKASGFVYHGNFRIPRGHFVTIARGESVRNWTHKKGGERFHAPRFPQFHDRFSRRLFFTQSDR